MAFVIDHFSPAVVASAEVAGLDIAIFQQLLFPFLLFSKPRHKTASLVWELIEANERVPCDGMRLSRDGLLGGCVEVVRWEEGKVAADARGNIETMANINIALATKLAGMHQFLLTEAA